MDLFHGWCAIADSPNDSSLSVGAVIGIAVGISLGLLLVGLAIEGGIAIVRKRKRRAQAQPPNLSLASEYQ